MSGNRSLHAAARNKKDEFYTQLTDIEKEMRHYRHHFKNKIVFCNCDDPFESNFFKYFVLNFNRLGLKKLMATCYVDSPIGGKQLSFADLFDDSAKNNLEEHYKPYKAIVTKVYDTTGDGGVDMLDVAELFRLGENELTELQGDGDFRSDECIKLLEEADIVVTNPPFSQFREYLSTLIEYDKSFIILGNQNAITYKEVFPLLMENKVWLGYHSGDMAFMVPDSYEPRATRYWQDETGQKWRSLGNICWFTNLDIRKRHEELILVKRYNPVDYPKYDNYDAINVDRVADIPCDYFENMAVPITYMDKYNPDQFDIVDANKIRTNDETPYKEHGLIKDKDAVISTKRELTNRNETATSLTDRQTDRQTDYLCQNCHQTEDVMASWASRSHSSTSTIQSSSNLLERQKVKEKDSPMDFGMKTAVSPNQSSMANESINAYSSSSGVSCNGIMGVPITFLDKHNPDQFEILGLSQKVGFGLESHKNYDNYKEVRQDGSFTGSSGKKTNGNPVLAGKPKKNNYYVNEAGDCVYSLYARIFIRRKLGD